MQNADLSKNFWKTPYQKAPFCPYKWRDFSKQRIAQKQYTEFMQSYKIKKIVQLGLIFERSHSLIYGGQNQQCIINKTEEPFL